jgi:hypothetical protein
MRPVPPKPGKITVKTPQGTGTASEILEQAKATVMRAQQESTLQNTDENMWYNTLPVARYGPAGGANTFMTQGKGIGTGTSLGELPKLFNANTVGDAKAAYWSDPESRQLIEMAARIHYAGNPNYTPQWDEGFWNDIINASMNPGADSPWEMLDNILSGRNLGGLPSDDDGGGGGGGGFGGGFGGGGGGGPQINLMNENDARAVVNSLASAMIGRTVSEKEFQGYYSDILKLQKENPTTVEFGDDGTQTVNQSIGAEGIRYNLEEQMRNTEDFVTTSIGTQGLDMLEAYIAKRSL